MASEVSFLKRGVGVGAPNPRRSKRSQKDRAIDVWYWWLDRGWSLLKGLLNNPSERYKDITDTGSGDGEVIWLSNHLRDFHIIHGVINKPWKASWLCKHQPNKASSRLRVTLLNLFAAWHAILLFKFLILHLHCYHLFSHLNIFYPEQSKGHALLTICLFKLFNIKQVSWMPLYPASTCNQLNIKKAIFLTHVWLFLAEWRCYLDYDIFFLSVYLWIAFFCQMVHSTELVKCDYRYILDIDCGFLFVLANS